MRLLSNFAATADLGYSPRLVGILAYKGISTLDLTAPLEALSAASFPGSERPHKPCYKTVIVSLNGRDIQSESGISFRADGTTKRTGSFDTIIVPGGKGVRDAETNRKAAAWLVAQAPRTRRICSVSTGVYALAQSGLLDGRHVTTHWRFTRDLAQRYPRLQVSQTASFLKDDRFYTSAGGSAGAEMALALIEEDYGAPVARAVARELVMRLRPAGEFDDSFRPTNYQADPAERVADLPAWVLAHLSEKLTVETLAERACLCPRHFSRVFKQVFNCTPADFVEELRLSEARRRLLGLRTTIESVAESVGFNSSDAFRRAFERRLGITPTAFRRNAGVFGTKSLSSVGSFDPSYARQASAA